MCTILFISRYNWDLRKFPSRGYWSDVDNQRKFMDHMALKLRILHLMKKVTLVDVNNMQDWYTISVVQFCKMGGSSLLNHYGGSLIKALQSIYPQHVWKSFRLSTPHHVPNGKSLFSKTQLFLLQCVQKVSRTNLSWILHVPILPEYQVEFNYLLGAHSKIIELDVSMQFVLRFMMCRYLFLISHLHWNTMVNIIISYLQCIYLQIHYRSLNNEVKW